MIEVQGLIKKYGDLLAVDGLSFRVEPGTIFGLLGPNGAGKSTVIGCMSGLLPFGEGSIRILGHDVVSEAVASRRELGMVPQELALYEDLSATENLKYWGAAYGMRGQTLKRRVAEVLDLVGLADRAREAVKKYSGGMKRRLNFACGVIHEPKVLLLDEPTVGVDPQSRVKLLDLVRAQAAAGTCVLYTTHYMEEAEQLCHRLAIVDHGRIMAEGSLDELRAGLKERDLLRISGSFDPEAIRRLLSDSEVELVQVDAGSLTLAVVQASRQLTAIIRDLEKVGAELRDVTLTQPSLESLFIKLTGRELRE